MELSYGPAIPLLEFYLGKPKTLSQKNICNPMFLALFIVAKIWTQLKCPSVDKWIKKVWYIYIMEYYLAMKTKEILPFVIAWMDLESIMLSETSQLEKDNYHMIYSYVECNEQNALTSKIVTDSCFERRLTAVGGLGGGHVVKGKKKKKEKS